jgi:hypothetical protein
MSARPDPELTEAAAEALAEVLAEKYPGLDFIPKRRGKRLPRGARLLRGALPDRTPEAVLDVREPRPRQGRADHDAVDE